MTCKGVGSGKWELRCGKRSDNATRTDEEFGRPRDDVCWFQNDAANRRLLILSGANLKSREVTCTPQNACPFVPFHLKGSLFLFLHSSFLLSSTLEYCFMDASELDLDAKIYKASATLLSELQYKLPLLLYQTKKLPRTLRLRVLDTKCEELRLTVSHSDNVSRTSLN